MKGMRPIHAALLMGAACLLALFLYLPSRQMGFYYDDKITILNNEKVQSPGWSTVLMENPFRALVNVTFAIQHRRHTSPLPFEARTLNSASANITRRWSKDEKRVHAVYIDPATARATRVSIDQERGLVFPMPPASPFRRFNMAVHLITGILLYLVARRLVGGRALPVLAASLFILHPLATEPVNYITARFTLMSSGFSLLAVFFHLLGDDDRRWDIGAVAAFLFALFCKETAAVLPLVVFVLDTARGKPRPRVLVALAISAVYFGLRMAWPVIVESVNVEALPWYKYILTGQTAFWLYLGKTVLPVNLNFDYVMNFSAGRDVFFFALTALVLGLSVFALARESVARLSTDKKRPGKAKKQKDVKRKAHVLVWAGAGFFMAWLSVAATTTFIALADPVKEDRAYTVLLVAVPLLVAGASRLSRSLSRGKRTAFALAAVLFMSALTFSRNLDWRNELDISKDVFEKSPMKPRAAYNYATALKWRQEIEAALHFYRYTLYLDPTHENAKINERVLSEIVAKGLHIQENTVQDGE